MKMDNLNINSLAENSHSCANDQTQADDKNYRKIWLDKFSWLSSYYKKLREYLMNDYHTKDMSIIMDLYIDFINADALICYKRPARAKRLAQNISNEIHVFKQINGDLFMNDDSSATVKRFVQILAVYIDMELKASVSGKNPTEFIVNQINLNIQSFVKDYEEKYILDVFLSMKRIFNGHKDILRHLFKKYLYKTIPAELDDILFMKYIIIYKKWCSIESSVEKKVICDLCKSSIKPKESLRLNESIRTYLPYNIEPTKHLLTNVDADRLADILNNMLKNDQQPKRLFSTGPLEITDLTLDDDDEDELLKVQPLTIKQEFMTAPTIVDSVDLTEDDDDFNDLTLTSTGPEWLQVLKKKAIDAEILETFSTNPHRNEIINLDEEVEIISIEIPPALESTSDVVANSPPQKQQTEVLTNGIDSESMNHLDTTPGPQDAIQRSSERNSSDKDVSQTMRTYGRTKLLQAINKKNKEMTTANMNEDDASSISSIVESVDDNQKIVFSMSMRKSAIHNNDQVLESAKNNSFEQKSADQEVSKNIGRQICDDWTNDLITSDKHLDSVPVVLPMKSGKQDKVIATSPTASRYNDFVNIHPLSLDRIKRKSGSSKDRKGYVNSSTNQMNDSIPLSSNNYLNKQNQLTAPSVISSTTNHHPAEARKTDIFRKCKAPTYEFKRFDYLKSTQEGRFLSNESPIACQASINRRRQSMFEIHPKNSRKNVNFNRKLKILYENTPVFVDSEKYNSLRLCEVPLDDVLEQIRNFEVPINARDRIRILNEIELFKNRDIMLQNTIDSLTNLRQQHTQRSSMTDVETSDTENDLDLDFSINKSLYEHKLQHIKFKHDQAMNRANLERKQSSNMRPDKTPVAYYSPPESSNVEEFESDESEKYVNLDNTEDILNEFVDTFPADLVTENIIEQCDVPSPYDNDASEDEELENDVPFKGFDNYTEKTLNNFDIRNEKVKEIYEGTGDASYQAEDCSNDKENVPAITNDVDDDNNDSDGSVSDDDLNFDNNSVELDENSKLIDDLNFIVGEGDDDGKDSLQDIGEANSDSLVNDDEIIDSDDADVDESQTTDISNPEATSDDDNEMQEDESVKSAESESLVNEPLTITLKKTNKKLNKKQFEIMRRRESIYIARTSPTLSDIIEHKDTFDKKKSKKSKKSLKPPTFDLLKQTSPSAVTSYNIEQDTTNDTIPESLCNTFRNLKPFKRQRKQKSPTKAKPGKISTLINTSSIFPPILHEYNVNNRKLQITDQSNCHQTEENVHNVNKNASRMTPQGEDEDEEEPTEDISEDDNAAISDNLPLTLRKTTSNDQYTRTKNNHQHKSNAAKSNKGSTISDSHNIHTESKKLSNIIPPSDDINLNITNDIQQCPVVAGGKTRSLKRPKSSLILEEIKRSKMLNIDCEPNNKRVFQDIGQTTNGGETSDAASLPDTTRTKKKKKNINITILKAKDTVLSTHNAIAVQHGSTKLLPGTESYTPGKGKRGRKKKCEAFAEFPELAQMDKSEKPKRRSKKKTIVPENLELNGILQAAPEKTNTAPKKPPPQRRKSVCASTYHSMAAENHLNNSNIYDDKSINGRAKDTLHLDGKKHLEEFEENVIPEPKPKPTRINQRRKSVCAATFYSMKFDATNPLKESETIKSNNIVQTDRVKSLRRKSVSATCFYNMAEEQLAESNKSLENHSKLTTNTKIIISNNDCIKRACTMSSAEINSRNERQYFSEDYVGQADADTTPKTITKKKIRRKSVFATQSILSEIEMGAEESVSTTVIPDDKQQTIESSEPSGMDTSIEYDVGNTSEVTKDDADATGTDSADKANDTKEPTSDKNYKRKRRHSSYRKRSRRRRRMSKTPEEAAAQEPMNPEQKEIEEAEAIARSHKIATLIEMAFSPVVDYTLNEENFVHVRETRRRFNVTNPKLLAKKRKSRQRKRRSNDRNSSKSPHPPTPVVADELDELLAEMFKLYPKLGMKAIVLLSNSEATAQNGEIPNVCVGAADDLLRNDCLPHIPDPQVLQKNTSFNSYRPSATDTTTEVQTFPTNNDLEVNSWTDDKNEFNDEIRIPKQLPLKLKLGKKNNKHVYQFKEDLSTITSTIDELSVGTSDSSSGDIDDKLSDEEEQQPSNPASPNQPDSVNEDNDEENGSYVNNSMNILDTSYEEAAQIQAQMQTSDQSPTYNEQNKPDDMSGSPSISESNAENQCTWNVSSPDDCESIDNGSGMHNLNNINVSSDSANDFINEMQPSNIYEENIMEPKSPRYTDIMNFSDISDENDLADTNEGFDEEVVEQPQTEDHSNVVPINQPIAPLQVENNMFMNEYIVTSSPKRPRGKPKLPEDELSDGKHLAKPSTVDLSYLAEDPKVIPPGFGPKASALMMFDNSSAEMPKLLKSSNTLFGMYNQLLVTADAACYSYMNVENERDRILAANLNMGNQGIHMANQIMIPIKDNGITYIDHQGLPSTSNQHTFIQNIPTHITIANNVMQRPTNNIQLLNKNLVILGSNNMNGEQYSDSLISAAVVQEEYVENSG